MQINAADLTYGHSRAWLYVPEGSRMLDQISKSHHAGNKENTTGPSDDLASEKATLKNTIPGLVLSMPRDAYSLQRVLDPTQTLLCWAWILPANYCHG